MTDQTTGGKKRPPSEEELLALPPLVPLSDAARLLRIGRELAVAQAKQGTFPVQVLDHGAYGRGRRRYVRKSDLLAYLGLTAAA